MVVFDIDQQWVADLIEEQTLSKQNKGYRYVLVVIDAFSKYAWARPIKKKTGKDVTVAFAKILKEAKGRKPQTLQTDADKCRQRILQSDLSIIDENTGDSSLFYSWRCQSQYRRTI